MSKLRASYGLAIAVVGFSGAAVAQGDTGRAEPPTLLMTESASPVAKSDRIFREALACVVKREPARSRAILSTAPGSKEEANAGWGFDDRVEECATSVGSISFSTSLLRGGLAEIYYHREFPNGLVVEAPADETAVAWTQPRLDRGGDQQLELLHSAAKCLVVGQPAQVRTLLAAEPFSSAEQQALGDIQKSLGPCLFKGVKFTASKQTLRGLLAEAAFAYGVARRDGFGSLTTAATTKD